MSLNGTIIRIDPSSGDALRDNPLYDFYGATDDPNAERIVADGLRNPFRFTIRPGTNEVWIGDVGWSRREEINVVRDPTDSQVDTFGWPAFEGPNLVKLQTGSSCWTATLCHASRSASEAKCRYPARLSFVVLLRQG